MHLLFLRTKCTINFVFKCRFCIINFKAFLKNSEISIILPSFKFDQSNFIELSPRDPTEDEIDEVGDGEREPEFDGERA